MHTTVKIHGIGALGEGIGTLEEGLKVFVEGALPGECVEVALHTRKKNYVKGDLVRILSAAPERTQPLCPLFGKCGGCHLMHLDYAAQLDVKRTKVHDALTRLGKLTSLPPVAPCVPSPHPFYYRNKIQLPVLFTHDHLTIGLYRKESHEIIDVPHCYIHHDEGIYAWIRTHLPPLPSLRHLLIRQGIFTHETLVILVTRGTDDLRPFATALRKAFPSVVGVVENINTQETNTILGNRFRPLQGRPYFYEMLHGKRFKVGAGSFFQVNSWQAENLVTEVLRQANLQSHETVYDAYTGVGTFALFLADHAQKVIGTECVPQAIACAQENAIINNTTNCTFEVSEATAHPADLTLLNPPRKGCAPEVLANLTSPRLIYISCDPATLARDLALLPHYIIKSITPFDLFPQTVHVETVVSLEKRN